MYKISNGASAKVIHTEYTTVGERTSKLQGRTLTLSFVIRGKNNAAESFILISDNGRAWKVFSTNGKCELTGHYAHPVKRVRKGFEADVMFSNAIKILLIKKL
jgi:hypothetical protein